MNLVKNRGWRAELAMLALGMVWGASALVAQDAADPTQGQPQQGPPARAVRLSYVDGQVKLSLNNQVVADPAVVNTPLLEGMQLTTADNGKAEVQFEDGSVARIAPYSTLTLSVLRGSGDSAQTEILLNSGLAYFEFQGGNQAGQIKVRFGDYVATANGFTAMRVAMDNPPGQVAAFSGNIHVESGNTAVGVAVDLHGGEDLALNAANPGDYELSESIASNSWDTWNSDRDQALTAEASQQTGATADMGENPNPAWNDLDANGNWYNVPGEGYVWSPYEAASTDFDPYGYGNWVDSPGYGYVWASGYSWGYWPYQCGLWNYYDGFGWGWAPGMGRCRPWWGIGLYGGPNIGHRPPRYRVIQRPGLPRRPVGTGPIPVIAVRHQGAPITTVGLPSRDKNAPVRISGNTVVALHARPMRPVYSNSFKGGTSGAQPGGHETQPTGPTTVGRRITGKGNSPAASGSNPPANSLPAQNPGRQNFQPVERSSPSSGPTNSGSGSSSHSFGGFFRSGSHSSGSSSGNSGSGSPRPSGGSGSGSHPSSGSGGSSFHSGGSSGGGGSHSSGGSGGSSGGGGSHSGGGGGGGLHSSGSGGGHH